MIERLRNLSIGTNLKARVFRGSMWLGFGGGLEYGLRFLRNIILARILLPDDFGLMAIILAVNAILEAFTQMGLKEAIIQSPDGEEDTYLNVAWWLSFVRSIGLWAIAMMSVKWLATFYNVSQYEAMFRISFLAILLNGSLSARAYVAQKRMDFKAWTIISSGGGAVGILAAIGLSFWLQNAWALVVGFVLEAAGRCFLSFVICPYVPRLKFKREHSRSLLTFARGILGLPILFFIFAQTDIFVVGKLLSNKDLGLYSMAISLAQIPLYLVHVILSPLLMPSFSERQQDKDWINGALIKATRIIALLGAPVACFFALYGKDVLTIAYGIQYAVVAVPFAILLFTTYLRAAATPIANVYLAIGHPEMQRLFSTIRAVLILLLIYPAVKLLGLVGAAMAGSLAMLISYYFQVERIREITGLDVRQYGFIFIQTFMISLPVVFVWCVTHLVPHIFPHNVFRNVLLGFVGCVGVYGLIGVVIFKMRKRPISVKESF